MKIPGNFTPTAIGSMPHDSAAAACDLIDGAFSKIPFWPQLAKSSFYESMYAQYSEHIPGIVIDEKNNSIYVDTRRDLLKEAESLYEHYLAEDLDYFAITEKYAAGFYEFLKRLKAGKYPSIEAAKGHVTGPVSFGLTVTDEEKKGIIYNPELKEALVKALAMRARWQTKRLKELAPEVIMFIDEPYLVSVGSSVVNIQRDMILDGLNEVSAAIRAEGGIVGIHCCGNTDWGLVISSEIDILNFDAYECAGSLALYPEAVDSLLKRGGRLAWGIVPTSEKIEKESAEGLLMRLEAAIDGLVKKGLDREAIVSASLITPSCGCGSLPVKTAEAVVAMTAELSMLAQKKFCS